jgi:dTDP-4-dehydrorhamnose 3,5-epimerase
MKIIETNFEGLIVFSPTVYQDERGAFYESWKLKAYEEAGIQDIFLQDNVSVAKKHVLKGLHYQHNQGQMVTVIYGSIFDVVVDMRPTSNSYKQYFSMVLKAEEPTQIYMPPGFAHGFCVLSDMAIMNYKCTQYYDPSQEGGIIWNDPELGIEWPEKKPIISGRDLTFPKMVN